MEDTTPKLPREAVRALYTAVHAMADLRRYVPREPGKSDGGYEVWRINNAINEVRKVLCADFEQQSKTWEGQPLPDPEAGDHMTMGDWIHACEVGPLFVDNDGIGYLATKKEQSKISIYPSDVTFLKLPLPKWATHVVWYNK